MAHTFAPTEHATFNHLGLTADERAWLAEHYDQTVLFDRRNGLLLYCVVSNRKQSGWPVKEHDRQATFRPWNSHKHELTYVGQALADLFPLTPGANEMLAAW